MMQTEAWVLYQGLAVADHDRRKVSRGKEGAIADDALALESFEFADPRDDECLVEPLYGCWEGNLSHALTRSPVDICRLRNEPKVIIGNAGVVRVLTCPDGQGLKEGDLCFVFPACGPADRAGYQTLAMAYDAPNTMGVLAKRSKMAAHNLVPIPPDSGFSLMQWAVFSLRYITAWSNHKLAYGAWRLQVPEEVYPDGFPVWGWGGGVSFAQLTLAKLRDAASGTLITSSPQRRTLAEEAGLAVLDRSNYPDLPFDAKRYHTDPDYARCYRQAEKSFLAEVKVRTGGEGVAIFIDNIGAPVYRVTLKALAREGVITTCGWKRGMRLEVLRAVECMQRHTHVHTHYANRAEADEAIRFACEKGWMPPPSSLGKVWEWEEVSELAEKHVASDIESYFPVFRINPE